MYETWFGLSRRPFSAVPQPDEYFSTPATAAAYQAVCRCVQRGEGTAVVIGPSGTGKTLLAQMLAQQFHDAFRVVLLNRGPWRTRRDLLQAILHELDLPFHDLDEGELRLALVDHLIIEPDTCPRGILLLVDDAHQFPLRVLDELRVLTNVTVKGEPRVRLVLIGASALEERLASPKLDSFAQRIVARGYLESFTRCETTGYIQDQLRQAGGAETIAPNDVCENIYRATDGVPRLVNQLCDHALLLAHAHEMRQMTASCVEEAWADLQQLPTPWNSEKSTEKNSEKEIPTAQVNVIEFGSLDSDDTPTADTTTPAPSATAPKLRVTTGEEEIPPELVEPIEQVESAEPALASTDDDFQPLASIGPKIEIASSEPGNPFSEHFEEVEEVTSHGIENPLIEQPAAEEVAAEHEPEITIELRTAAPSEQDPTAIPPDDEPDIIKVEEGYDDQEALPPVSPTTHKEYRRLFAKLRHG